MSDFQQVVSETLTISGAGDGAETALEVIKATVPPLAADLSEGIQAVAQQAGLFQTIARQQAEMLAENTQAILQNTAAQTATGGAASTARNLASTAARTLGGGLGLVSLVSSIVGLFRGKKPETPAPLPTYTAPPPIRFEGAAPERPGMPILALDYGQDGLPRQMSSPGREEENTLSWLEPATIPFRTDQLLWTSDAAREPAERPAPAATPAAPSVYAPAVTVQVQAMDSRSFLDHSDEIARAVREALLNAHALGSVVSEL